MEEDRTFMAAYVAAFIDGEGHVGLHETATGYFTRSISFCNTDKQLFDRVVHFCEQLGFKIIVQEGKQPQNIAHQKRWICYVARGRQAFIHFEKTIPLQADRKKEVLQRILCSYYDRAAVNKRRRTGEESVCPQCNATFYKSPAFHRRGGGRFCSVECRDSAAKKRVAITCSHCGKPHEVIACLKEKAKFCSQRCQGLSRSDRMRAMAKSAAIARWAKRETS